ncbi:hypothetical protein QQS21_000564 [Conoideocrella luteorostrata]|uniref:3-hydroxyisobutyrate dehydrogenase protein n=1 Tax=Conoideocrella luteorostrata TaxID=1105319 RepID=A0AAJ0G2P0_9HYPO|nr:hypothetical protein QQS21_000564 [Conoideocrella luteorostrata]
MASSQSPAEERDREAQDTGSCIEPFSSDLLHVRPSDGKLVPLVLQSFESSHRLPQTSRWLRRDKPRSTASLLAKVSYWIWSPVLESGVHGRKHRAILETSTITTNVDQRYDAVRTLKDNVSRETERWQTTPQNLSSDPSQIEQPNQAIRNYSDGIPLDSHPVVASHETNHSDRAIWIESSDQGTASRPRYLCFIQDYDKEIYETISVTRFIKEHGDNVDIEFVFVSYTREQFRVSTDEEISKYDYPNEETREANRRLAEQDRRTLLRWGIDAAKKAGKKAFWIDFECVRDKDGEARSISKSDDVYRICDVVRAAHSMIIAIGPLASEKVDAMMSGQDLIASHGSENRTKWLRHWGSRLWTLPELLLCPGEHRVKLYTFGDDSYPIALAKRNFAERAWVDADAVKELVNHYEGSAILTSLRLIETALACFSRRGTKQFSSGDVAYAIMGLLPHGQRPAVRQEDSGFQAFARLSLANDGGDFLSRLICLLPQEENGPWFHTSDTWGAKISDVRPSGQITKVMGGDTILVDGMYGANIQWDGFGASATSGEIASGWAWNTLLMLMIFSGMASIIVVIQVLVLKTVSDHGQRNPALIPAQILVSLIFGLPIIAALLLPALYLKSRQNTQNPIKAHLIGIEGHVDAATIERHLWGHNHNRFTSTSTGAQFLDDPQEPNETPQMELDGKHAFTLVDTYMMTVLHFYARDPPVAMFIAGQEGGMQRALLCSYHWQMDVFARETVLRVGTEHLDRMRRVDRFRLCLSTPHTSDLTKRKEPLNRHDDTVIPWRGEMLYMIILLVSLLRDCIYVSY